MIIMIMIIMMYNNTINHNDGNYDDIDNNDINNSNYNNMMYQCFLATPVEYADTYLLIAFSIHAARSPLLQHCNTMRVSTLHLPYKYRLMLREANGH